MRKIKYYFLFLFYLCFGLINGATPHPKAVTYQLSGGRLGNNLIAYLHGKWISEKYHLPLLYVPFPYSIFFSFHNQEPFLLSEWKEKFPPKVTLKDISILNQLPNSILLEIPYFRDEGPRMGKRTKVFFHAWNNPKFKKRARELLQPQFPIKTVELPKDRLNVVVHVRTGVGYDARETQLNYPEKFPPHSFYISALRKISQKYAHRPIYAFIMTDDPNPAAIADMYSKGLPLRKNIVFDYRKEENGHKNNVLEDFYSIPKFDCLIRSDSTFAVVASLLADFKVVVSPKKCHVANGEIIVDAIDFQEK